jgi:hypothetical protein
MHQRQTRMHQRLCLHRCFGKQSVAWLVVAHSTRPPSPTLPLPVIGPAVISIHTYRGVHMTEKKAAWVATHFVHILDFTAG